MKTHMFPTFALAVIALTFSGCENKNESASQTKGPDKTAGASAPSVEETKAIAEEAFIYGLPIVMNYAVMNEFCIDKNSGQFKAPFNVINNEARVFTYKDTALVTPNRLSPQRRDSLPLPVQGVLLRLALRVQ